MVSATSTTFSASIRTAGSTLQPLCLGPAASQGMDSSLVRAGESLRMCQV
jgi:hypothetical protein